MITFQNYRTDEGVKCVLVDDRGHKWLVILMITDKGLVARKAPKSHACYLSDVYQTRKVAPISTLLNKFEKAGRTLGNINKGARKFLKEARA